MLHYPVSRAAAVVYLQQQRSNYVQQRSMLGWVSLAQGALTAYLDPTSRSFLSRKVHRSKAKNMQSNSGSDLYDLLRGSRKVIEIHTFIRKAMFFEP